MNIFGPGKIHFAIVFCVVLAGICHARQPAGLKELGEKIVPRVRIEDDTAFFAAWDLDRPGMEPVRTAVEQKEFARAKAALKEYFLQRREPRWKINHWEMPETPRGKAEKHSRYQQGEDVLAHKFSRGGYEMDFGDKIDWNYFPLTLPNGKPDTEYPLIHSLNRFFHFSQVLGPLYWYSHDERYAREFVHQVTDHVLSNPAPEQYIRYTAVWSRLTSCSPLNGSWLDGYNYFLPSEEFTPEAHAIMLKGFIEKARYAVRAPDGVNRYMIQLAGIYNVGAYFPELKEAKVLREFAVKAMKMAAEDEFYPDTISKELCPGYHGGSRSAMDRIVKSAQLMGYEAPPELEEMVRFTYGFYPKVATPLHNLPRFGDTWETRYGSITKTFEAVRGRWDEPIFEWFASEGKSGTPPPYTSISLPWAGFYVMRSGWDRDALYLCLDAGPVGKGHWHEDYGNFECYAYGEHLLAEVGVYSYTYNKWNQYFRSSLAHNLVIVDGYSQRRAGTEPHVVDKPREQDWHSDPVFDLAWGRYTSRWSDFMDTRGRNKVDLPATHRRDVCFIKNRYWIISDRLTCPGPHTYEQLFHFSPDRTVKVTAPGRAATTDEGRANLILAQADPDAAASILRGREDPPQGWFSGAGGKVEPAPVVSFQLNQTDQAHYDTVLFPLRPGENEELLVERIPVMNETGEELCVQDICALRIATATGTDFYINDLRQAEIGPLCGKNKRAGKLETNARAAVVRLDLLDQVVSASATGGTVLKWEGKEFGP